MHRDAARVVYQRLSLANAWRPFINVHTCARESEREASLVGSDCAPFRPHTDESIRAAVACIQVAHETDRGSAERLETLHGWGYQEFGLALDDEACVGIASAVLFDWAHTLVSDGLADQEFAYTFKSLHSSRSKLGWSDLAEYIKKFTHPRAHPGLDAIFSEQQIKTTLSKKTPSFPGQASQFLTLCPMLVLYLREKLAGDLEPRDCPDKLRSLLAVCELVELVQATKNGSVDVQEFKDSSGLDEAILCHTCLCSCRVR